MFFSATRPAFPNTTKPLGTVVVDAEEDFDWTAPVEGTNLSTFCMRHIRELQAILSAYGIKPTYLLTYPILDELDIVRILDRQLSEGQCSVGIQLHSWVTPPFAGDFGRVTSFAGNLDSDLEEKKLVQLIERFTSRFGRHPKIFRAGRYGLGSSTARLLEQYEFEIDTSIAPRTTMAEEGGPDFAAYDYQLFWFGEKRNLLEVPLCRSIVGWGGSLGAWLHQRASAPRLSAWHFPSVLANLRYAERVTLSPEGNDCAAMRRLVRSLLARGQTILPVSFHSSSLTPGRNPYVRSTADLHQFYDQLSAILTYMVDNLDFTFVGLEELPAFLAAPPALNDAA